MEYETEEFSRITGVPVKTLRFYREEGLLVPRYERPTGDYYYSEGQADDLGRITVYRSLGMSTRDISGILAGMDVAGILEAHRAWLSKEILVAEERAMIANIAIENIEFHNVYRHELRRVSGCRAYYITGRIGDIMGVGEFLTEARRHFDESDYSDCVADPKTEFITFLEDEYKDHDIEAAYAVVVDVPDGMDDNNLVSFKDRDMLCTLYKGRYDTISDAYVSAARWMSDNGYRTDGMMREIVLDGSLDNGRGTECTVELQIPVRSAE